ncbi:pyridoxamine 5'-phosphate oxidase family protein [Lentzea sp. NBC_00516]|uniref:pyridoxamine 5'-phosphate oxidase family protein n=1 Tax=Lentzea sp. NBC_00516 TaxID=2903582 RepID=UPI002E8163D7|nr:pyridoxamine 5'-phosphate oxidase family protein [Lentzea sp. NBC_00516]WUD22899.1 pyridoxamine 5'-phosphate oxidase family protein [Lentzea sp. NBC_00516]
MATWAEFAAEQPDMAAFVQDRFAADRHALLATLRKDGSPRISGVEPDFTRGELWAGMMFDSLKSKDLRRDPRFALHCMSTTASVAEAGDAKISGTAEFWTDKADYLKDLFDRTGWNPSELDLFRFNVTEVVQITTEGDEMVVLSWHEGRGTRRVGKK